MSGSGVQLEGQYRPGMVPTLREQGLDERGGPLCALKASYAT